MGDCKEADPEKEKKRKKALRRMGKILGKAWELPNAAAFYSSGIKSSAILCLTTLGEKLDQEAYRYGRHGWEDFARDIGGVYNRHVHRKLKHAKLAKSHLKEVAALLGEKDESLAKLAREHIADEKAKKRKSDSISGDAASRIKRKSGKGSPPPPTSDPGLGEREERAMENLVAYIQENGGKPSMIKGFRSRVTRKPSDGRYDTNYYNDQGRRFRSMVEVGKFLNLVTTPARSAAGRKTAGIKKRKATSREIENEKKKLRKELEKLRRQHTKARKQLDDFLTEEKDAKFPMDDALLHQESNHLTATANAPQQPQQFPTNCAAARLPDMDRFSGLPQHCMPEVLMVWDFLSTFSRNLNVNPIPLDDFVQCLVYKPPPNLSDSDMYNAPPVFLGEAHLGLLKFLLGDRTSDDWWWSILETDVTENKVPVDANGTEESDLPLIRVDFAALLMETEDPLITTSWLQNLERVRKIPQNDATAIRSAIKNAMAMVANKWVLAYLRKALKLGKTSGPSFMKQSILWLVDKFMEARPDLGSRSVNTKSVFQQRAKVVEEVTQQMEKLSSAVLAVNDEDLASDNEDSDDESDESDDEDEKVKEESTPEPVTSRIDPDERRATEIPTKPPPSLIDLLLPPGKPTPPSELFNPASWPQLAAATVHRLVHRYKRLRNELDDSLRTIREIPRLTVKQRRERERISSSRVFSEFSNDDGVMDDPSQKAVEFISAGGNYLELSPLQRLCMLRVLIDATYDTFRVHEIVQSNHKQRTNAVKALDTEQRKAKREAKEKAAAGEAAAREDLALEAKRNFIEEKREEIRKANQANHELTEDEIDELTEEDILDFDDDIRADFEALPGPESFKKVEVMARVAQIDEAAAFETDLLTVVTMEKLLEKEEAHKVSMEEQLEELGGEEALLDPSLDRSIARTIEKLRRELTKIQNAADTLPIQREAAIDTLKESIADGTIKSLRAAIRIAKTARLFGPDPETNGVWALDLVRDAHMELENAKHLKKVADAQKDLVNKLNRCFIRTDPLGMDRFRNRLWKFENTEHCHVWAEVSPVLAEAHPELANEQGYFPLVSKTDAVTVGAADIEEDFVPSGELHDSFQKFSRQEYHESGLAKALPRRHWGCHTTEASVRAIMKGLDGRGIRENALKKNLKEALEKDTATENPSEENKNLAQSEEEKLAEDEEEKEKAANAIQTSGDEASFEASKQYHVANPVDSSQLDALGGISTAIGQRVRARMVQEKTRDAEIARYEDASITGWKVRKDTVAMDIDGEDDDDAFDTSTKEVETPIWHALTGKGQELWLTGTEVLESICRARRLEKKDPTYFESDAAFLSYRNALGRHCGKVAEAGQAMTPIRFSQFMVRREAELYQRLKHLIYDNSWGGKSGNRNAWVSSMQDFAFDFETARDGLITLESSFYELTGGVPAATTTQNTDNKENGEATAAEAAPSSTPSSTGPSGKELLENPSTREDIELESLEKGVQGLWNSPESRAVFLEIMRTCQTVGFLALGLELVCRNTRAYIDAHMPQKSSSGKTTRAAESGSLYEGGSSTRGSRRSLNAWQSQDESSYYYEEATSRPSRRVARVNYIGLD